MKVKYDTHTCGTKSLLQQKFVVVANSYSRRRFSAAFTSRTKPDRSNNLISNNEIAAEIEITSWLVSAYDFYSRVVKDR